MNTVPGVGTITKDLVFKGRNSGKAKETGNPYDIIELHDPVTLENLRFFIRPEHYVNSDGLMLRDKVTAVLSMDLIYGKLQPVLVTVSKKI